MMNFANKLANELTPFEGGYMLCEKCESCQIVGNIGNNLSTGWPNCKSCGNSMLWVTGNQTNGYKLVPHELKYAIIDSNGKICDIGEGDKLAKILHKKINHE